jgi:phosphatidylglycerol lysyltransferase
MTFDRTRVRRFFAGLLVAIGCLDLVEALVAPHWLRSRVVSTLLPDSLTIGGRTGIVIAGLGLLLLARGIARGKRVAWQLTVGILLASVVFHLVKDLDIEDALLDSWIAVGLWWLRHHFQAESDPTGVRRGLASLAAGAGLAAVYAVAGSWLLQAELARLYSLHRPDYQAMALRATWFADSLPWVAGGLVLLGLLQVLRPGMAPPAADTDRERLRSLIGRFGHNPVCHLALFGPSSHFWAGADQCIAYSVVGRSAIALGDPIACDVSGSRAAAAEFLAFCDRQGWTGVFYEVEAARPYSGMGLTTVPIGSDAVVPVRGFSLSGKERAGLRHAAHHCDRLGVRFTFLPAPGAMDSFGDEMTEVLRSWLGPGRGPEMGFSLGTLATLGDPAITVGLAHSAKGRLEAFVSWLPAPARRAWTLDLMRRRPDGPTGVMETLITRSIEEAARRGLEEVSLGLAPLAITSGESDRITDRALRQAYEHLDRFRRSRSLRQFKSKFAPRWEERYLIVPDAAALPEVLVALLRVHLPPLSPLSVRLRLGRRPSVALRRRANA